MRPSTKEVKRSQVISPQLWRRRNMTSEDCLKAEKIEKYQQITRPHSPITSLYVAPLPAFHAVLVAVLVVVVVLCGCQSSLPCIERDTCGLLGARCLMPLGRGGDSALARKASHGPAPAVHCSRQIS
ncbi:hypothetical protein E2C01_001098 [Portunus trituberculatus]|uniref:Uncharacterized protein n=1 Tax=Portunus trituberculatus TaxID=210409 RepID=A0A5B7CIE9_PORTR|nr:hypothetical protein [Portunus trituberculatus]